MSEPQEKVQEKIQEKVFFSDIRIALVTIVSIALHLLLLYTDSPSKDYPLYLVLAFGGLPLTLRLAKKLLSWEFSNDLIAGVSIVTAVLLGEYLAAGIVVLMLSGGETLEHYAALKASGVLRALAERMPRNAYRMDPKTRSVSEIEVVQIQVGDLIVIPPHSTVPVDGIVVEGHSEMDEAFLTGEPFRISKTPGSEVISGAINGESSLTVEALRIPSDSRYAKIVEVISLAEKRKPRMRRLADRLGAFYTPVALVLGVFAYLMTGDPRRFLSVIIIATPCPLLIGIPVAIVGSISLAARRGIIIRDPSVMERTFECRTMILDKTGTLTYGTPVLSKQRFFSSFTEDQVLPLVSAVERYSRHPLADTIIEMAKSAKLYIFTASQVSEKPGQGLTGLVQGKQVVVTSRKSLVKQGKTELAEMLSTESGLECVVLIDGQLAAQFHFRDKPRRDSQQFIKHLKRQHRIDRVLIVSGDRESEVQYLADFVGIKEIYAEKSPEEKLEIVEAETKRAKTIYVGDGINDAPALVSATVGVAFGSHSSVTAEAAQAIVLDSSLSKLDEFLHICQRMRRIAGQSAIGGMGASVVGMLFAAFGYISPVMGAVLQEVIDLFAVLNALRAAFPPKTLTDFDKS